MSLVPLKPCNTYADVMERARSVQALRNAMVRPRAVVVAPQPRPMPAPIAAPKRQHVLLPPPPSAPAHPVETETPLSSWTRIPVTSVIEMTAAYFGITMSEITSRQRVTKILWPRQIGYYVAAKMTPVTLAEIGRKFGLINHAAVIHGCGKVQSFLDAGQPEAVAAVDKIMANLRALYPNAHHPPPRYPAIAPSPEHPTNGLRWTEEEKIILVRMLQEEKKKPSEVAPVLGRTIHAVLAQAVNLGVYTRGKHNKVKLA
jgi:hypothetical protein